ncbi:unnamed protein product [Periconia digitata]|uniref:Amine oxidase domain-containing protein n=1 Tax=Periconia digitata TaxID=1303443 RepID=A0A9W4UW12_9PLEO|nr:unnamed protein product [Periconia digitata]
MGVQVNTFRGRYAAEVTKNYVRSRLEHAKKLRPDAATLPRPGIKLPSDAKKKPLPEKSPFGKVCIVGAGVSGTFMAWMLTYLGIEYDLLESSDHTGGRVKTHEFPDDEECKHNYYDVGAMRIPLIDSNLPTRAVIEALNIPHSDYILSNPEVPNYFYRNYNIDKTKADEDFNNVVGPFVELLNINFNAGFDLLVNLKFDDMSTREVFRRLNYQFKESQTLETFNTGTGLFDQSFTETVLDTADFPDGAEWWRVEGGMIKLVEAMEGKIKTKAKLNSTVQGYKMVKNGDKELVEVEWVNKAGKVHTDTYSALFNSTTLGALSRINLNGLGSKEQREAIRSLAYDSSTKVGIKFKTAWWLEEGRVASRGGVSGTDLPIRVVAYPPWAGIGEDTFKNKLDDPKKPTVLIASYTWHQDAVRIGSMTADSNADHSDVLKLVLRNLVELYHEKNPDITYEWLYSQVVDWHTFSWQNDSHSSGAFALFGPGQFTHLYPHLLKALEGSNNSMFIIGEHASAHHAWIAGALYSSATSLYVWLRGLGVEGSEYAAHLVHPDEPNLPFASSVSLRDGPKGLQKQIIGLQTNDKESKLSYNSWRAIRGYCERLGMPLEQIDSVPHYDDAGILPHEMVPLLGLTSRKFAMFVGGREDKVEAPEAALPQVEILNSGIPDELDENAAYWMAQLSLNKPTDSLFNSSS